MQKVIELTRPVYDICKDHPEVIGIMKELGFDSITNPAMLNTAGRVMTIEKGAKMKNIPLEKIKEAFVERGYTVR